MKLTAFVIGFVAGVVGAVLLLRRLTPPTAEKFARNLDREWARISENLKTHRE